MPSNPNINLFTWLTANGIKVSITLEELSIPYQVMEVDISSNAQKESWFIKINPNGRIPAILDGGQRVFESGAILLYLTDKYDSEGKISYQFGTSEYYGRLSCIMFQIGGVGPMQGQANHFRLMAGEYAMLYSVLNERLGASLWLAGHKYTIADICNYSWVRYGPIALGIDLNDFPNLKRWHDTIHGRTEVRRGINVPRVVTDEQLRERYRLMEEKTIALRSRMYLDIFKI
ncbi:glutathione S-transferase [Trichoderma pleuroticola]